MIKSGSLFFAFILMANLVMVTNPSLAQQTPIVSVQPLRLVQAYSLENDLSLEPSGLAVCNGELVMVSDKHDELFFSLVLKNAQATVVPHTLNLPDQAPLELGFWDKLIFYLLRWFSNAAFDWEAVSCDLQQRYYFYSERLNAVLFWDGMSQSRWITPNIPTLLPNSELFRGQGGEGLGVDSKQNLYITVERDPRGIVILSYQNAHAAVVVQSKVLNQSELPPVSAHKRSADFTDVLVTEPYLYTLQRNHSAICRRDINTFDIQLCWSFAAVEQMPQYRFRDDRYGLAEGLAVLGQTVYVVLDNNRDKRLNNASSNIPWLFAFELPENW